jgi:FAD/FMN-containing dehydrogenase
MPPPSEAERELETLAGDLRRLESEYTKFFAGRAPRPPLEARAQLDREFRKWANRATDGATARFRLQTLQSRYSSFVELWDRAMRAREEGRPGPLAGRRASVEEPPRLDSEVFAAVMHDPAEQPDRLRGLYDAMMEARKQTGHDIVPFERFADLVRGQVERLRATGASDVMFRVSVNEGRPNLTARPVKRKSGS